MGKKNYGKSVKTRLLNLMNETGYKYMVSSGKILQRETALHPQTEIISQFLMEVNLERGFLFRPEGRFVPYAVPTLYYRFVSESG